MSEAVYLQPQRAPTRATDKADDAPTMNDGGNNDGGDGSATTTMIKVAQTTTGMAVEMDVVTIMSY